MGFNAGGNFTSTSFTYNENSHNTTTNSQQTTPNSDTLELDQKLIKIFDSYKNELSAMLSNSNQDTSSILTELSSQIKSDESKTIQDVSGLLIGKLGDKAFDYIGNLLTKYK